MSEGEKCPECGAGVAAGSPQGLCPKCLFKRGLEGNTGSMEGVATLAGRGRGNTWEPMEAGEIARRFPELEGVRLIGRGGMGAVYWGMQKSLSRAVALKVLPLEVGKSGAFQERFEREARAMARLSHPHIVAIHEFGVREGLYYFVMEYVDGLSLRALLESGHVTTKEALAIVPEICDALAYAHEKGIVHRDIKPENILLTKGGRVKIADFGLAKLMGEEAGLAEEKVAGTPRYMAPEQMERPGEVDHRADIYALGVVFYQMLTGELPSGKDGFEAPSRRVVIDVRLDEVVLKALEKEPGRRYQSVGEIKTEVETIVMTQGAGAASMGTSIGEPGGVRSKKRRVSRLALAGLAWIVCFFVMVLLQQMFRDFTDGGLFTNVDVVDLDTGETSMGWKALMAVIGVLGFTAPIGATFLGWMAMRNIKRSDGRVIGIPLAVVSELFFPLMVMNAVIAIIWKKVMDIWFVRLMVWVSGDGQEGVINVTMFVLCIAMLLALVVLVDYWLTLWLWTPANRGRGFKWTFAMLMTFVLLGGGLLGGCAWGGKHQGGGAEGNASELSENPFELRKKSTEEVIAVALQKPESPWVWQTLSERDLSKAEATLMVDGIVTWLKTRKSAETWSAAIIQASSVLERMSKAGVLTQEQEIDLLAALQGDLDQKIELRWREGRKNVSFNFDWRNQWHRNVNELVVLNAVKGFVVDGQPMAAGKVERSNWNSEECSGTLDVAHLKAGKHEVKVEVATAIADKADLAGLPAGAQPEEWPGVKRKWIRHATLNTTVYGASDVIVEETRDPKLDPLATGGITVKPIIVRTVGNKTQVVVVIDVNDKLAVPLSFDAAVRIGGQTIALRTPLYAQVHAPGSVSLLSNRAPRVVEIKALDPGITTADVVLTPNARAVEQSVDYKRIWGGVVEIKGVEVKRQGHADSIE